MRPKDYQPRKAKAGDIYAYYIKKLNKYCLYQILNVDRNSICYTYLDYLEDDPPTADMLQNIHAYYLDRKNKKRRTEKSLIANTPVPHDYLYIGKTELKAAPKCEVYTGMWPSGEYYLQIEKWKDIDPETEKVYLKYKDSGEKVIINGVTYNKNKYRMCDDLYHAIIESRNAGDFPCITDADVSGYSDVLADFPLLRRLHLKAPDCRSIDLGKTHIDYLEIDVSGVSSLILPPTMEYLKIYGKISDDFSIDDSLCSNSLCLTVVMNNTQIRRYGLSHVNIERLMLGDITELDLRQAAEYYPEIEKLILYGKPGNVSNFEAIGDLEKLEQLVCSDVFGYTAAEAAVLENLPNLYRLDLYSIPKEAGEYLKKHWKGRLDFLSVRGLRSDEWLKENLHEPLRHWDGSEFVPAAAYKKSVKCCKETKKMLLAAESREEIEEIVRQYTLFFNALNAKYDMFIETEEREDIFVAMQQLFEDCLADKGIAITLDEVWNVMDEMREEW